MDKLEEFAFYLVRYVFFPVAAILYCAIPFVIGYFLWLFAVPWWLVAVICVGVSAYLFFRAIRTLFS